MREILFRGKIIEPCEYQGQWLEGFYAVENGKPFIAIPKENGLNGFYCDPETVGQYTGLTDINNEKLFEGDIIKFKSIVGKCQSLYLAVVRFGKYAEDGVFGYTKGIGFYLDYLNRDFVKTCSIGVLLNCEFKILGNVSDNPELWKWS